CMHLAPKAQIHRQPGAAPQGSSRPKNTSAEGAIQFCRPFLPSLPSGDPKQWPPDVVPTRNIAFRAECITPTSMETESSRRGLTKSRLVREALENAFGQRTQIRTATVYDLTRDLCGSVRGGTRDLASNKKHLADYGT
ncbi:MAG: hypothetical protein WAN04_00190, partial [Candidatus Udaeobacter sp.]